jgi:predicted house-cleaning noncanonical NTP pyrophosphatase (MazG superfamily)
MKSDNQSEESESIDGFKQWVLSLNREELLDAMAFTFQPDSTNSKSSTTTPTYSSLHASAHSGVKSHEYDLLLSMVQLQPPPPTPVHPRATGYKSRSQKGARLDFFFREEEHLRWTKPRLFQWAEEENQSALFYKNYDLRAKHRDSSRNHSRNRTNNNLGPKTASTLRFNVIARQKIAPWGDVYSLGCTQEQCDADRRLIQGTRLGRHRIDGTYHANACFVCSGIREVPDRGHALKRGNFDRKGHRQANIKKCESLTAASIINMLRIASRGQFFLQHPMSSDSKTPIVEVSYCAPWLQPTERWFSLGMYLASRFQMALWDSYLKGQLNKSRQKEQIHRMHPGRQIRQGVNWHGYKESILKDSLIRAIRSGLRDILKEEQMGSRLNYLRDGTLWSILEGTQNGNDFAIQMTSRPLPPTKQNAEGYWKSIICTWTQIKLVDIHLPFNSKFKSLINEKLEEEVVARMEQSIFEEDKLERQKSCIKDVSATATSKKRRKKSKRKKTKNRNGFTDPKNSQAMNANLKNLKTVGVEESDPVSTPSDSSSVEEEATSSRVLRNKIGFPRNSVTAQERNRNVIFVLGILDDITEKVFSKVGLNETPKFDDSVQDAIPATGPPNTYPKSDFLPQTSSHKDEIINKSNGDDDVPTEVSSAIYSSKSFTSGLIQTSRSLDQEVTNHNVENAFSFDTEQNRSLQSNIYNAFEVGSDFTLNNLDEIGGYVDNWRFANRYQSRERSILTNFFESQNGKIDNNEDDDDEERLMAASTAASIASSSYKDTTYVAETEELTVPDNVVTERTPVSVEMSAIKETEDVCSKSSNGAGNNECIVEPDGKGERASSISSSSDLDLDARTASCTNDGDRRESSAVDVGSDHGNESNDATSDCRSPTLQAPTTPPPTLSPILVSLADLKKMKRFPALDFDNSTPLSGPGSLPPNSPGPQDGMSREDLRIESFRDDQYIKNRLRDKVKSRRGLEIPTYKSIAAKDLTKPIASPRGDTGSLKQEVQFMESIRRKRHQNNDSCAQSETAIDSDQREHQDWYREETENNSLTKDETTTIISGISHRVESEELAVVQEERNNFRDMCLTLGAEVAKLKVMLATQQAAAAAPLDFQDSSFGYSKMYGDGSFDPHGMQPFFSRMNNGLRPGPMSDAGFHRYGDHESLFSEEEAYDPTPKAREARIDSVQRMASSQTIASQNVPGSDLSVDFNSVKVPLSGGQMPGTMYAYDSFHFNGLQSRLTEDILQFLDTTNIKMKKLDGKRKLAVQRT